MQKLKILVATHKKYIMPTNKIFLPIKVGGTFSEIKEYENDNNGKNISEKNKNFCELTAIYWAWKNINSDYIGLCHYRRYFDFKGGKREKQYQNISNIEKETININEKEILELMKKYDVILPKQRIYPVSIARQYKIMHKKDDWKKLLEIITEEYPEYLNSAKKIFDENNKSYLYNMMIMEKNQFDGYCKWLFKILFKLEHQIEISKEEYQARIFGFLSERLLNLYVYHNKLSVKELPITFFDESNQIPQKFKCESVKRITNDKIFKIIGKWW